MAWDSSRPVNWKRLLREWAIYMAILAVVFAFTNRAQSSTQQVVGLVSLLVLSFPLYMGFGYVLSKLGLDRRRKAGAARTGKTSGPSSNGTNSAATTGPRPKPAPTKRTGGGRPTGSSKTRR